MPQCLKYYRLPQQARPQRFSFNAFTKWSHKTFCPAPFPSLSKSKEDPGSRFTTSGFPLCLANSFLLVWPYWAKVETWLRPGTSHLHERGTDSFCSPRGLPGLRISQHRALRRTPFSMRFLILAALPPASALSSQLCKL